MPNKSFSYIDYLQEEYLKCKARERVDDWLPGATEAESPTWKKKA